jgi:hypothetical protein
MSYVNEDQTMSIGAMKAYKRGEKPLSKIDKHDLDRLKCLLYKFGYEVPEGLTVDILKKWLKRMGKVAYHHTSPCFNKTNFYSVELSLMKNEHKEHYRVFNTKGDIILKKEMMDNSIIGRLKKLIKDQGITEEDLKENIKNLYKEFKNTDDMKKRQQIYNEIKSDMYVLYQHVFCDIIENDDMFELFLI